MDKKGKCNSNYNLNIKMQDFYINKNSAFFIIKYFTAYVL